MLAQGWRIAENFGFSVYHTLECGLQTSRSNKSATSLMAEQLQATPFCGMPGGIRQRGDCAGENNTETPERAVTGFSRGVRQYIPPVPVRHNEELRAKRVDHCSTKKHYDNAVPSVQINGKIAGPIPIRCSIRQDCAMNMVLFALCINTFIRVLERNLSGVSLGWIGRRMVVVAYADDVIIFVTKPTEFSVFRDAVRQ